MDNNSEFTGHCTKLGILNDSEAIHLIFFAMSFLRFFGGGLNCLVTILEIVRDVVFNPPPHKKKKKTHTLNCYLFKNN